MTVEARVQSKKGSMRKVKVTLKPTGNLVTNEAYKLVKLVNSVRVAVPGRELRVGDMVTEKQADQLVADSHNEVTVIS